MKLLGLPVVLTQGQLSKFSELAVHKKREPLLERFFGQEVPMNSAQDASSSMSKSNALPKRLRTSSDM